MYMYLYIYIYIYIYIIYIYIYISWEEDDSKQFYLVLKVSCRQTNNLQPGTTYLYLAEDCLSASMKL